MSGAPVENHSWRRFDSTGRLSKQLNLHDSLTVRHLSPILPKVPVDAPAALSVLSELVGKSLFQAAQDRGGRNPRVAALDDHASLTFDLDRSAAERELVPFRRNGERIRGTADDRIRTT